MPGRTRTLDGAAPSRGRFVNSGKGPTLQSVDIGHADYLALIEPDSAFWALVRRDKLADAFSGKLPRSLARSRPALQAEMDHLRFGLTPSAVYFNPTERCNLDCTYCYIPPKMRRSGRHMPAERVLKAMEILHAYFRRTLGRGHTPQIIFHGAEPLLNRDAVFEAIDRYKGKFLFGVQTNATRLDDSAVEFLTSRRVSIGLSLDAHSLAVADRTRRTWDGRGVYGDVLAAMDRLKGYDNWSVICTVSSENVAHLSKVVDFFHRRRVPTCLMNILRCTLPRSRQVKPDDATAAKRFIAALERTSQLYRRTGRKLVVGNFANILLAILAPSARRLMCDVSPCGGGRCFFALAPDGGMFPCSEFIGLENFRGGNLFTDNIPDVLKTRPFELVTGRKVEDIEPCRRCAIRHFCGSPCPAEAHEMNGGMNRTGAFCEFYEEQVRYAFRLIADGRHEEFLWDGWDEGLKDTVAMAY
ncbi:MAG: Anaerobic sulfatase-maturating enzyme [Planctomycetes bacterium ADurb.Bin126]|nr:MAG: Anaerobic sulfatase-maturating enzyme [Planctomycetes bacterium ADurb.Bin126]HOD82604.1 peptide-modifying radical SAM enzyme CbpB [Phycisphaerae bacterium]HQL75027.1 peptide-modifying radical SAM enzyme CbpB [Phycisphaerae bacterium]